MSSCTNLSKTVTSLSLMVFMCLSYSAQGYAADPKIKNKPSKSDTLGQAVPIPTNSDDNFISDRISFPVAIWVTTKDLTRRDELETDLCATAGTQFRGIGKRLVLEDKVQIEKTIFLVEKVGNNTKNKTRIQNFLRLNKNNVTTTENDDCTKYGRKVVERHQAVVLNHNRINSLNPVRKGVTYGTLIIPYKYHSTGASGFSGGTTLGGYLGYRVDRTGFTGFETNFVTFAGAANISVPETVGDQIKNSNRTGASYGIGILATVKDEFQIGLVFGRDKVDEAANYERNGKSWVALSLGYEFSN